MLLPPLKPRHIGIGLAGVLLSASGLFFAASLQTVEYVEPFQPVMTQGGDSAWSSRSWRVPTPNRWLYLVGMSGSLLCVGALAVVKVNQETLLNIETLSEDLPESLLIYSVYASHYLSGGLGAIASWSLLTGKKTAKTIYLKTAPTPIKDYLAQIEADRTWFKQFLGTVHNLISGITGDGKSYLELALVADWLEHNPDGTITICDLAYGKPDPNGWVNDWFGLPLSYIRRTDDDIMGAIDAELEEMQKRQDYYAQIAASGKRKSKPPAKRLLVIAEFNFTIRSFNQSKPKLGDEFAAKVEQILFFGRGYGFKLILDCQSIAVNVTGLSEAVRSQLAVAILGKNATTKTEPSKLGGDTTELVEKCQKLKERGKRPAIVQLGEATPRAVIIPDLSYINNIRIVTDTSDAEQDWWLEVFTPSLQKELEELVNEHIRNGKSMLKTFSDKLGVRQDKRDSKYTRFVKPNYEQAYNRLKNTVTH